MQRSFKRFLVTGGAGFIGSAFIRYGLQNIPSCEKIINLDLLTYAAHPDALQGSLQDPRYLFIQGDILDQALVEKLCVEHDIESIIHFAAETHVDRSICFPHLFYKTNVEGTISLLEVVRRHPRIHFHHISTDEVFGSLEEMGSFDETSPYRPNSPYSASKAAADHFVRAYGHTYGLSTTLSYCTNNYGPGQHVEKFIPAMLSNCWKKTPFSVYGKGENIRDWIFVDDHVEALWMILEKSVSSKIYGIGGGCEKRNIDLLHLLIAEFAKIQGADPQEFHPLIQFVPDRLGHDFRYAIDSSKIHREIGWRPLHDLSCGIRKTISWYLENPTRLGVV
ncbi:MAG: dTDP-glucose 4,6-dehydratase [Chlamydiales bacterium]|nr:dTDP-glucose 4,6-dehydratase [Chlamydiales bacterium]